MLLHLAPIAHYITSNIVFRLPGISGNYQIEGRLTYPVRQPHTTFFFLEMGKRAPKAWVSRCGWTINNQLKSEKSGMTSIIGLSSFCSVALLAVSDCEAPFCNSR